MILFNRNNTSQPQPRRHGCLWTLLVFTLIYFIISGILGVLMGDMFATPVTTLNDNAVYRLTMRGTVLEQGEEDNPFAQLFEEMPGYEMEKTVGLDDLISNIRLAKNDDKIKGIYLYGGEFAMGQATAKALRDALLDFKASGKWILAYAEHYSATNYYVASVADKVYLNPVGSIDWNGLSAQKMYYKRLLDKIGIEMQILKVGTYKSAVEPYFRTSMSEADRQQTQLYLDGLWDILKEGVSAGRHIPTDDLERYADLYMGLQPQDNYVTCGFVDSLLYVQDMDSILRTWTGVKDYTCFSTREMSQVKRDKTHKSDKVAVVYAEGEITDRIGDGIVGDKMIKLLKKIGKNNQVKAVVLRVNSPGGSADASEQIHHALSCLQAQGKPVVVSMGDYAASGGYYISCHADYIYTEPNTLTGSIGIFGTIPNLNKLRDKVGIDIDGTGTNRLSSLETDMLYRGMNDNEYRMMQGMVERGYDLFTRRCAEGRHMSQDAVKDIGEGRVWLGKDAIRIGLADASGNVDDAVIKAAELASLDNYTIAYYPEKKDFLTELMESMEQPNEEEQLILKIKEFASKPRIMALMPYITIK